MVEVSPLIVHYTDIYKTVYVCFKAFAIRPIQDGKDEVITLLLVIIIK